MGAGRPRKYTSEEERKAAKRLRDIAYWHQRRTEKRRQGLLPARQIAAGPVNPNCEEIVRPPPEVLAERDHRYGLMANQTDTATMLAEPPASYASFYYIKAWRIQRRIARGEM